MIISPFDFVTNRYTISDYVILTISSSSERKNLREIFNYERPYHGRDNVMRTVSLLVMKKINVKLNWTLTV